jgi:L-seryl-tRNA(Ser) seleniumtransferase
MVSFSIGGIPAVPSFSARGGSRFERGRPRGRGARAMIPSAVMTGTPQDPSALLRRLPAVQVVLEDPATAALAAAPGRRGLVLEAVRKELDAARAALLSGDRTSPPDAAEIGRGAAARLRAAERPLPRVLNATGVILHSGLGRAPMPEPAIAAANDAGRYCLLEVDRERGERRARDTRCIELMKRLTGAEAGLVVNNNAAATVLILATLARGREVVCSRGELVEIGGSYRIPEVMEASGCTLTAVGATNKTHLKDYERAIRPTTGALLIVHTSNYRIVGFSERPALEEIVALGRSRGLPVVHDLGSGSLLGPEALGLGDEPPISASLAAGADLVCLSGDKLLGGPQAGIILGRADLVRACREHPLARAFRVDKARIAALEAVLELFLDPRSLDHTHPVTAMLRASPEALRPRAERLAARLRAAAPTAAAEVVPCASEAGSGALPALPIPSTGVAVASPGRRPDELARALRAAPVALFTVIREDRVLLDVRTLTDAEADEAADVVAAELRRGPGESVPSAAKA